MAIAIAIAPATAPARTLALALLRGGAQAQEQAQAETQPQALATLLVHLVFVHIICHNVFVWCGFKHLTFHMALWGWFQTS